ncbi:unnamed protein product [Linum tenue]|uniref:Uncharacterized protein n=2 Tax=Linum tenue TaxID=586396 RepID=A0AAV0RXR8_9ROSI|nr:unnamed protein product [Linum tenue]
MATEKNKKWHYLFSQTQILFVPKKKSHPFFPRPPSPGPGRFAFIHSSPNHPLLATPPSSPSPCLSLPHMPFRRTHKLLLNCLSPNVQPSHTNPNFPVLGAPQPPPCTIGNRRDFASILSSYGEMCFWPGRCVRSHQSPSFGCLGLFHSRPFLISGLPRFRFYSSSFRSFGRSDLDFTHTFGVDISALGEMREKECMDALQAFNDKNKEKVKLVTKLMGGVKQGAS